VNKEWAVVWRFVFRQQLSSVWPLVSFPFVVYWIQFLVCLFVLEDIILMCSHMFVLILELLYLKVWSKGALESFTCLFWSERISDVCSFLRKTRSPDALHTVGTISAYTIITIDFSRNNAHIQVVFWTFFLVRTLT